MEQHELGKYGETLASQHLQKSGYIILDRNWKFGKIEIDIVVEFENQIIFVEVKTRENDYVGQPWEAVTISKQKRIIKAAHQYLIENDIDLEARFDIISIIHNSKYSKLEHLKEAFYPTM